MSATVTAETAGVEPRAAAHVAREVSESMDERHGLKGKLKRGQRLGTRVWVWYLTTGAVLAVARVALLKWVARGAWTPTDAFVVHWLFPESIVSLIWNSLVSSYEGTAYTWLGVS